MMTDFVGLLTWRMLVLLCLSTSQHEVIDDMVDCSDVLQKTDVEGSQARGPDRPQWRAFQPDFRPKTSSLFACLSASGYPTRSFTPKA